MMNYARQILDGLDEAGQKQYAEKHGTAAFKELWDDAHAGGYGGVPPLPSYIPVNGKVMTRAQFDTLDPKAKQGFIREGGRVADQALPE